MINFNYKEYNQLLVFGKQIKAYNNILSGKTNELPQTIAYKPPEAKNVDEYFDMGSIEIEIDGEADPEMVMAEVKEIIEERKRRLQERQ